MSAVDRFHAHLDECHQCADHPFDLCPVGEEKIRAVISPQAVDGIVDETAVDASVEKPADAVWIEGGRPKHQHSK